MQTTISSLPVLRRRKPSRTERIKHLAMAAIPIAVAKKAVPDSGKGKAASAGGLAVVTAAIAGAAYKLRGRSHDTNGDGDVRGTPTTRDRSRRPPPRPSERRASGTLSGVSEPDDGHAIGYKVLARGTVVRSRRRRRGRHASAACSTTRASTSSTAS